MAREYHRVLLLFLDGIGLAPAGPANPFSRFPGPALEDLLGGSLTEGSAQQGNGILLRPIDATLGVEGLPQSATGQTALFSGLNGAESMGRHVTGFPGAGLRELIERGSIFRRTRELGLKGTFANAYSQGYLEALAAGEARASVTTCAVAAAGLDYRTLDDLEAGRAATWDIERDLFARGSIRGLGRRGRAHRGSGGSKRPPDREGSRMSALAPIDAATAGRHLARLAADHALTIFESFLPDLVGHGRVDLSPRDVVRRLDGLLAGVLAERSAGTTLVVTSDHGNFEDSSVPTHTRAPVPLLAVGPAAAALAGVDSILDITPRVLEVLSGASN